MTVWRRDNVNQIHVLSGPGSGSNQGSAQGFFNAPYQLVERKLWKQIFTPRNDFRASIKLSSSGRAVLPRNSTGSDLN